MKRKLSLIFLVLVIAACAVMNGAAYAEKSEYKLQPTDVLKITVHEQPDLETMARISSDGFVSFPLIGKVHAEGRTVQELEKNIKDLLEKDYLVNAQVLVFIEGYHPRQVSVMGEVESPGKFDMPEQKDMTFLEAVAMAGGFTEDAQLDKVKVIRAKNGDKETITIRVKDITERGQKEKDIVLEPDDIVFVPESFF